MTRREGNAAPAAVDRAVEIRLVDERKTAMIDDVRDGLGRRQKELPPKYFYDERGSELFEKITRLPEYYLTRSERSLLETHAHSLVGALRPRTLVELGAGSAAKTRILLDAMRDAGCAEQYVPVDVSQDFLAETARQLRKKRRVVEAAYNDGRGVTAAFNRNMLRVLNRELGADFDVASFGHRAFYSPDRHRIEMHLVSARDQVVHIPQVGDVHVTKGETIRTEISCKYDRPSVRRLLRAANLRLEQWMTDEDRFALAVALPRP